MKNEKQQSELTGDDRIRRAVALLTGVREELMCRDEVPDDAKVIATKAGFLRLELQLQLRSRGVPEYLRNEEYELKGSS